MVMTPEERREAARQASARYRQRFPARVLAYAKKYRETHPEEIKAYQQVYGPLYQANHVEQIRVKKQQYYQTHKEQKRTHDAKYNKAHPEKRRIIVQRSRRKNATKTRETKQRYRESHREEEHAYRKKYVSENLEKFRGYNNTRRARKRGAALTDLSHAQWIEIQESQDHRCYYCGKRCKGRLTQDHIIPLSKGGSHTLHNVIGACKSCNSRKRSGPPPKPVQPLLLTIAKNKSPNNKKP